MDRNLRIRMLLEASDRVTRPLREMAGGSTKAAQALKATRDRLKEIERAQADIKGFRELKLGLRASEQAMQTARAKATELGRALAQADTPTRALTRDFNRAKKEAEQLSQQHQADSQKLDTLRSRLREAGVATTDLVRHERELRREAARTTEQITDQGRRMQAMNARSRRMSAVQGAFRGTIDRASGMAASGAAGIATGVAVARPLFGAIGQAQEYQSVMTDIAQKADLSRDQATKMGAGLLTASRAANQLPEALQQGVDTLAGFGLDPRKAVEMMTPIGRAATAYKAEIPDLSAAAFAANDNLKVPVEQTARVIDIMAQAGKSGAFEIKDMAQYFPTLTAGYQALGQKGTSAVGDLAAALQIARKGAGDAASAATNIENVLQKISSPATVRSFAKMGVDLPKSLKKMYAEGKTPLEAIAELTNKTLKGDLSKIGYLFEDAQVQQGLRPLIQNMEEYRRIRAQANGAAGVTDRDFAERMQDSAEQTKQLKIQAQTLAIALGTTLLPTVNAIVAKANVYAQRISAFAERHPAATKAALLFAASLATVFFVLGTLGIVAAGIMGPLAVLNGGLVAMGVSGGLASVGLLPIIGTVLAIVAAVALLVGAAYLIYRNWGAVSGFFTGIWAEVHAGFAGGVSGIIGLLTNFSPVGLLYSGMALLLRYLGVDVPLRLTDAGRWMIQGLINGITGMLGRLRSTIVNAASAAANWFKAKLGIHSPSRVFAGFGGYMMDGLSNGIAAGQSEPVRRIDRLARQVTAAMAIGAAAPALAGAPAGTSGPSASARGPSARSAPGGMIVTINIRQQPGQDAAALAEAVRKELAKVHDELASNNRASFADQPDWDV